MMNKAVLQAGDQSSAASWFIPDWLLPPGVRALQTVRYGGLSVAPYASFNLGDHVGDDSLVVAANRARLGEEVGRIGWLKQVHGTAVVDLEQLHGDVLVADASVVRAKGLACSIMTADCLPVLFCAIDGSVVGAAHAGWRGLLDGVLEATLVAMAVPPSQIRAWLGPAIGPDAFEVGGEVREAFLAREGKSGAVSSCFSPLVGEKWLADLYALAKLRLISAGLTDISGGGDCTVRDRERYFSYRRDKVTGRMASLIWRE